MLKYKTLSFISFLFIVALSISNGYTNAIDDSDLSIERKWSDEMTISTKSKEETSDVTIPKKLKPGDKVAILAPSNPATEDRIKLSIKILEKAGFTSVVSDSIYDGFTGDRTGEKRAMAFNKLVSDNEIKAIICLRGGYGSVQLLDKIDYKKFRENHPIFIGFSDITAMHTALFKNSKVVTYHGPMTASNKDDKESFEQLFKMLQKPEEKFEINNIDGSSFEIFKEGTAEGQLVGGNMTLISSLMGTKYEIDTENKILFLEEIDEPIYKLDRILQQLRLAGKFDKVKAIIIGDLHKCYDEKDIQSQNNKPAGKSIFNFFERKNKSVTGQSNKEDATNQENKALNWVLHFFEDNNINVPIIYNVHAGHGKNPITLPLGAKVAINGNSITVNQKIVE